MKLVSKFALALSLFAVTAAPAFAQSDEKPKKEKKEKKEKKGKEATPAAPNKNTKPFATAYVPVSNLLVKAKDAAAAKAEFPKVVAAIGNDYDRYLAGMLAVQIGVPLKDVAFQEQGIDLLIASSSTPLDVKREGMFQKGRFAYDSKRFADAEKYMIDTYNLGYVANNIEFYISNAMSQQNKDADAIVWIGKAIAASKAAGQINKTYVARAASLAAKAKDFAGAANFYKDLVIAENNPDYWHDALAFFNRSLNTNPEESLDLMRLMRATNGLRFQQEYAEYLDSLSYIGVRYPAEAVSVLDEGFAKGVISRNNVTFSERYNEAKARLAEDTRTLAGTIAPAKASPRAMLATLTGDSFFSHKDYKTAKDLYETALSKGPVLDKDGGNQTDRTRFRLAMSKAMLGDYAGAKADFAQITGANRKAIAEYWVIYINHLENPAPAAAAPAATPAT
jgi:tetratricopeptide (TPR) repeat protein